jgi:hypothetical protein
MQLQASRIFYIPDIEGPTDAAGNRLPPQPQTPGSLSPDQQGLRAAAAGFSEVMSDGSGFISDDLARLVPAVSAGELVAAERGQGVLWPHTPLQVRGPVELCQVSALLYKYSAD